MKEMELKVFQKEYVKYLKILLDFFSENGIKYSLAYGTLLGAIREHDIIPWDTDIDLWLFEDEMRKIENLSSKLPECFYFKSYKKDEEYYGLNRVYIKSLYRLLTNEKNARNVYIDLFVMKKIDDFSKQPKIYRKYEKYEKRAEFKHSYTKPRNFIKRLLKPIFRFFAPTLSRTNKKIKKIMSNYKNGQNYMVCLHLSDYVYPASNNYVSVSFGAYSFYAFENSKEICSIRYGDNYMTPINYGVDTGSTFFIKN